MESWLSAHLFYEEPLEKLLLRVVKPACHMLLRDNLISKFFFIRYWEGGPHIRLRVKGNEEELKEIEPFIRQHFSQFINLYPSVRYDPEWIKSLPKNLQWHPNNTMQLIRYEAETERYGGIYGVPIAEKQFEASSKAVLEAIGNSIKWDLTRALGLAIQLHLSFAYAVGMQLEEAILFFSWISSNWLLMAYWRGKKLTNEDHEMESSKVLDCFKIQYQQQEKSLMPFCLKLWKNLQSASAFEQEWLTNWVDDMSAISVILKDQHKNNNLLIPTGVPKELIPSSEPVLWCLYDSFIHMTNNRLGVLNRDEAYVAFLIKEALSKLN
jgi:thiopeptide-type bacteriocin biosynthesis protein